VLNWLRKHLKERRKRKKREKKLEEIYYQSEWLDYELLKAEHYIEALKAHMYMQALSRAEKRKPHYIS